MIKELLYTIFDICKIIRAGNLFSLKNFKTNKTNKTLYILGNGKSLNNSNLKENEHVDFLVVNRHVLSENYKEIKPRYYVLADPHFFQHSEGLSILKRINDETLWEMTIYLPYNKNTRYTLVSKYINNRNISIVYYNLNSFRGFRCILHFLYTKQLSMPIVQNVLVASIMIGILLKYKTIELFGVEHTWTRYLYVDENNVVYLDNPHFFDKEKEKAKPLKEIQHTDEYPFYLILENYSRMFKSYWEINEWIKCKKMDVKIINKTPGSFIDAFEKG